MSAASSKYLLAATVVYVIVIVATVWGLFVLRHSQLSVSNSSQARDDWQQWRSDVEQRQAEPQATARRVPQSAEPPALVLMRDYFVTCLVGAVLFVSLLYWAVAGLAIGALSDS